jgi:hypothetical protein
MPRKRIPPTPLNISRRNELQYGFLETTNRACPEVVEDLKNVRRGQLPFDQFAEKYGIRGTWIEEAEAAIGAAQKRLNAIDKDVLDDYGRVVRAGAGRGIVPTCLRKSYLCRRLTTPKRAAPWPSDIRA